MARSRDQEDQEEQPEDYPDYPDGIDFKKFSQCLGSSFIPLVAKTAKRAGLTKAPGFKGAIGTVAALYL